MFGIAPVVLTIGVAVSLALGALVYALVPVKSRIASRLERVEEMTWDGPGGRSEAFAKIFNDEQRGRLRRSLDEAGWYTTTPAKIASQMIASAVLASSLGLSFAVYANIGTLGYGMALLLALLGGYYPLSRVKSAIKARKNSVSRSLPDFLDMLVSTVTAGLSFNAALSYAVDVADGPLGEEIKAMLSEIRLGRSRADALRSMADRIALEQVNNFVTAVVQSEKLGSNMSTVLRELSLEVRDRRMMRAEELANLMPTKMVLPMALFMLPALFLMIFGGIIAQYLASNP